MNNEGDVLSNQTLGDFCTGPVAKLNVENHNIRSVRFQPNCSILARRYYASNRKTRSPEIIFHIKCD